MGFRRNASNNRKPYVLLKIAYKMLALVEDGEVVNPMYLVYYRDSARESQKIAIMQTSKY